MKSYTIEELSELYKKKEENIAHKVENQADILFKALSSQKLNSKNSNDSTETSLELFNNQLNLNIEETISQEELRRQKREQNPLYQNWKEVCSHLDDSTISLNSKNNIQSNSRKIRRILNNEEEFQQSLRDHKSETYDAIIVDLLELNRQKIDLNLKYSENIDEYFKSKTWQKLFDLSNKTHKGFADLIDNDTFPKYYEYGYHSKETEKSFDLKIDREFLETFKKLVHNNLKSNNFNLLSEKICESPNNYEIVDSSHSHQYIKKKMKSL